jgi:hypothetical protein
MKKLIPAMAFAVALFNAASAYALPVVCLPGSTVPGCPTMTVPEPGGFSQVAVGLFAVAALAFVLRKRARRNEAN